MPLYPTAAPRQTTGPGLALFAGLALAAAAAPELRAQDRTVLFGTNDPGVSRAITEWGLDTAWASYDNMRRGVIYMGADEVDLVRVTFPMNAPVVNGQLTAAQLADVDYRVGLANLAGAAKPLAMTADTGAGVDAWFKTGAEVVPARWVQTMEAAARAFRARGKTIASASPFNEPDYGWGQGTIANLYDILGLLQASPVFSGVALAGPGTLNCDAASTWYNAIKGRVAEGTTHQLAGGFDGYASFYQNVVASGDKAVNEELHNVAEAIVGAEYGVTSGTWWGTAELARAGFVKACQGMRLGYAEHRANWTAAAVYRAPAGTVHAFVGASERQAVSTAYRFFNRDRKVFYDGQGPRHDHTVTIPGGTGYWTDQPNAERMVNITWGADVPPSINGRYILVNRASGKVMEVASGAAADGADIRQNVYVRALSQQWDVAPLDSRVGGDFGYHTMRAAHSGKAADLLNWSYDDGGDVIQWSAGSGANQGWFFEYVGDGWFRIRNRWSGKYLEVAGSSLADGANIAQWSGTGGLNQQWRFIPAGAAVEFVAPPAPSGLVATANPVSVSLAWNPVAAADLGGYAVLRSETAGGGYEIIARDLASPAFVDESARAGRPYYYVVRASDRSLNRSALSAEVVAAPTGAPALVARYDFDGDARDRSGNGNDAQPAGTASYGAGRAGSSALALGGALRRIDLPRGVASHERLTVATWVYWNGGANWQRVFDFGNGTGQYLFLTPAAAGAGLRFAIKNGGAEQQLNAPALATGRWVHLAVTLDGPAARLYVDGAAVASSAAFSIRPSAVDPALNYVGASQFEADPTFNGLVDDLRVYNYALSAAEVSALVAGPPPAPSGLLATSGPLQIQLSWTPVASATGYTLRYATGETGPYSPLASGAANTMFLHTGLNYGQAYYYTVDAATLAGAGPVSAPVAATPQSALITPEEIAAAKITLSVAADRTATAALAMPGSVRGHFYQMQFTDDLLKPWVNVGAPQAGTGADLLLSLPPALPSPRAFYRLQISR